MFLIELSQHCCGVSIKTGTKIIAIWNTFTLWCMFMGLLNGILCYDDMTTIHTTDYDYPNGDYYQQVHVGGIDTIIAGLIAALVVSLVPLVVNILLVFGIYLENEKFFVPWMVFESIMMAIQALAFAIDFAVAIYGTFFLQWLGGICSVCLLPLGTWIVLRWYIMSIVYTHFKLLKGGRTETVEFRNLMSNQ